MNRNQTRQEITATKRHIGTGASVSLVPFIDSMKNASMKEGRFVTTKNAKKLQSTQRGCTTGLQYAGDRSKKRCKVDPIEAIAPDEWCLLCEPIPGVFGQADFGMKVWKIGTKSALGGGTISRCRAVNVLSKNQKNAKLSYIPPPAGASVPLVPFSLTGVRCNTCPFKPIKI